eukprot:TRINITY_DN700_c1_g1_i1.p2 TRINITY_DN700_c1_g1~~TRINITY_DN700_c1_g1_i1.p2  ORF type:complete len:470 (+),score=129.44 TRINITY_DN700_c1_g1_i1:69-1478(+)
MNLLLAVAAVASEAHTLVDDMLLPTGRGAGGLATAADPSKYRIFPEGKVHYEIDNTTGSSPLDAAEPSILAAIAHIESMTCIRFTPCRGKACPRPLLRFQAGHGGCGSPVGMVSKNGVNDVSLAPGCRQTGVVAHEVLHSLGLMHEQQRADRDEFVTVAFGNVQEGYKANFEPWGPEMALGPYDHGSIMHYKDTAFAKTGKRTIISDKPIGQREKMSPHDARAIQFLYQNCEAAPAAPICMASREEAGQGTHVARAGQAFKVEFNGRFIGGSMSVDYDATTAPRTDVSSPAGTVMKGAGRVVVEFTPNADDLSKTYTLATAFVGADGQRAECAVQVRVEPPLPPAKTDAPVAAATAAPASEGGGSTVMIVAGAGGGGVAVALLILAVFCCRRRGAEEGKDAGEGPASPKVAPSTPPTPTHPECEVDCDYADAASSYADEEMAYSPHSAKTARSDCASPRHMLALASEEP